jgi:hypothetical protein
VTKHKVCKVRLALAVAVSSALFGCSDDGGDKDSSSDAARGGSSNEGGAGARAGTTGAAGTAGGGAGASGARAGSTAGGQGGSAGAKAGRGGSGGGGGGSAFTEVGVCGQRGMGTVDTDSFSGFEEFYIIDDEGFGEDICVVRFDVEKVGDGPDGCDDPTADVDCLWVHEVEYSNPSVVLDMNGVCAKSDLGFGAAKIAEIDGSRAAYGFVSEYVGHNSVVLKYDDAQSKWIAHGNATWDEGTSAFRFDRRDGNCNY